MEMNAAQKFFAEQPDVEWTEVKTVPAGQESESLTAEQIVALEAQAAAETEELFSIDQASLKDQAESLKKYTIAKEQALAIAEESLGDLPSAIDAENAEESLGDLPSSIESENVEESLGELPGLVAENSPDQTNKVDIDARGEDDATDFEDIITAEQFLEDDEDLTLPTTTAIPPAANIPITPGVVANKRTRRTGRFTDAGQKKAA